MRLAELADDRRLAREPLPPAPLRPMPWGQVPSRQAKARAVRGAPRPTTGFEAFLIAAVVGLFLWALILSPLFL